MAGFEHGYRGASDIPTYAQVAETLRAIPSDASLSVLARALNEAFPRFSGWSVTDTGAVSESPIFIVHGDSPMHASAEAWIEEQFRIGMSKEALVQHIKKSGVSFIRSESEILVAVGLDGQGGAGFTQIRIYCERQVVCNVEDIKPDYFRERSGHWPYCWESAVRSPRRLVIESGGIVHSLNLLAASSTQWQKNRTKQLQNRVVQKVHGNGRLGLKTPLLEKYPLSNLPCREERWFADWVSSSAGARNMGQSWYLESHDYVDEGVRNVGFIPQAIIWPGPLEIGNQSCGQLLDTLHRFDDEVKCPFGWFFYMVHGNRASDRAGRMIAEALRAGKIHFDPRDEEVLMNWQENPYQF